LNIFGLRRGVHDALLLRQRRDATKVIYEILSVAAEGVSKTQIIYRVNLSFRLAAKYIEFLSDRGWLRQGVEMDGKPRFFLTSDGERILRNLYEIEKELSKLFSGHSQAKPVHKILPSIRQQTEF
jgi:predicted transcriptional regulator